MPLFTHTYAQKEMIWADYDIIEKEKCSEVNNRTKSVLLR